MVVMKDGVGFLIMTLQKLFYIYNISKKKFCLVSSETQPDAVVIFYPVQTPQERYSVWD